MSVDDMQARSGRKWALLLTRLALGLLFFMAGVFKIFDQGLVAGAESMFVEPYRDTFLPVWALWASGLAVPFGRELYASIRGVADVSGHVVTARDHHGGIAQAHALDKAVIEYPGPNDLAHRTSHLKWPDKGIL